MESLIKKRMFDPASPSNPLLIDKIRSLLTCKFKKIDAGRGVVFKKNVEITMTDNAVLKVGDFSFFHEGVWLLLTKPKPVVSVGKNVTVGRQTIIAAKNSIVIGDYSVIAPRCYIIDHEHGFSPIELIHNQKSVLKETIIGRDCYLGTGTIVLAGTIIGDGSVIGAGSVVTKDIPPYQIWAGNPARYIKDR